jgi:hypothetical protein
MRQRETHEEAVAGVHRWPESAPYEPQPGGAHEWTQNERPVWPAEGGAHADAVRRDRI